MKRKTHPLVGGFAFLLVVAVCAGIYTKSFNLDGNRSRPVANSQRDTRYAADNAARAQTQVEADARLAAKKAADDATRAQAQADANARVTRLVDRAKESLTATDVAEARQNIDEALKLSAAQNLDVALTLQGAIKNADDPAWAIDVLVRLSDAELEAFKAWGKPPASLDLGYPILTRKAVANARASIDAVLAKRAETRKQEQEAEEAKTEERRRVDEGKAAAEAKERRNASVARMQAEYKERRKSAAERKAASEKLKQEEAMQAIRMTRIQYLINKGVFLKVEFGVPGATVWVGPTFYALSFDAKEASCSVVATIVEGEFISVTLIDVRSGKTVGDYGPQGWIGLGRFGLKMY